MKLKPCADGTGLSSAVETVGTIRQQADKTEFIDEAPAKQDISVKCAEVKGVLFSPVKEENRRGTIQRRWL